MQGGVNALNELAKSAWSCLEIDLQTSKATVQEAGLQTGDSASITADDAACINSSDSKGIPCQFLRDSFVI